MQLIQKRTCYREQLEFIRNYQLLLDKYLGKLYNDSDEFIGNKHFGISTELYNKFFSKMDKRLPTISIIHRKDLLVEEYLKPYFDNISNIDWRSVEGTTRKWQKSSISKTGRVYVTSIKNLSTMVKVDLDFCKLFSNHWLMYCADKKYNTQNRYPILAHNKSTNKIDGYIYPIK